LLRFVLLLKNVVFKASLKRCLSAKAGWTSGASRLLGFESKARGSACCRSSPVSARVLDQEREREGGVGGGWVVGERSPNELGQM
jgi:hypothetical protein